MTLSAPADALVAPAFCTHPPYAWTLGPEVADLCEMVGFGPDPEQRLVLDLIFAVNESGDPAAFEAAVIACRQNLKALAWDTPILTTAGFKPIVDVHPGDQVFHPTGRPVTVLAESDVKLGQRCYRVTTTDGRSLVADAGHLWSVRDARRRPREVVVKTTEELAREGIYRTVGAESRTVTTAGKSYASREYRWQLPCQDAPESRDAALPIDPYLFGAWLGDGKSSGGSLSSHADDVPHWVDEVKRCGFVPTVTRNRTCHTVGITVPKGLGRQSRSITGRLRKLGVLGNKHVPDLYLTASPRQREALLQGLMDTDGTIHHKSGQATFCNARRELADAVLYLARSLGWKAGLRVHRAKLNGVDHPAWNVTFSPKSGDPFRPVRMARKVERIRTGGRAGIRTVSIASIEEVPSRAVKCIRVDAEDGQFLAGRDLMVTHNTAVLEMASLGWLFLTDQRLIVWSAHEFKTAIETFRNLRNVIESSPVLMRRGVRFWTGSGNESIEITNGPRMIFRARTGPATRGLSGDKVILDEAFALRPEHMGSLLPTISARPGGQVIYGSSAGMARSTVLRRVRDRGRAGTSSRLAYVEWSSQRPCEAEVCSHEVGTPGCAFDVEEAWLEGNPSASRPRRANGTGVTVEGIRAEREALVPAEFGRERMGRWDEPGAAEVFGPGKWEDARVEETPGLPLGAIGIGVAPDLTRAGITGAGRAPEWVEVKPLTHAPGIGWTVEAAAAMQRETGCKVIIDDRGPGAVLIPRLVELGVDLTLPGTDDVLDACAGFYEGIRERTIRHGGYPELDAAVDGAVQRKVRDRWAWGRRESTEDILLLEGATLAAWALIGAPSPAASYYETNRLEVI